jgi:hypothetical protein
MTVFTVLLFLLIIYFLFDMVIESRTIAVSGTLPIVFACLVAMESFIMNALSLFNLVSRTGVLTTHVALLMIWLSWRYKYAKRSVEADFGSRFAHIKNSLKQKSIFNYFLPALLLLLATGLVYPPNNYDSMTYHMSRVAHWIQNGSVGYYETSLPLQNVMVPGVEYLILFLQVLSNSDYLANFVQFLAFVFLIFSTKYLNRIIGIPAWLSPYLLILVATLPMALLQASSTQTDLTASLLVYAIIFSFRRIFCGRLYRMSNKEFLFAGISVGSAFLVKPTALLAAFPIIVVGLFFQFPVFITQLKKHRNLPIGFLIWTISVSLVVAPDIIRKYLYSGSFLGGKFHIVRPLFSEWSWERFQYSFQAFESQFFIPVNWIVNDYFIPMPTQWSDSRRSLIFQEDITGNSIQFLIIVSVTLVTLVLAPFLIKRFKYRRSIVLAFIPVFSWFSLMVMLYPSIFHSRYQLSVLILLPFTFSLVGNIFKNENAVVRKILLPTIYISSAVLIAFSFLVITGNLKRPLDQKSLLHVTNNRNSGYYTWGLKVIEASHNRFLKLAEDKKCFRIGLYLKNLNTGPGNDFDYPLTWRAIKQGREVRHILKEDEWPCLIYSPTGKPAFFRDNSLESTDETNTIFLNVLRSSRNAE